MKILNGKELADALVELQVYKEPTKQKEDYSYYGIEEYYERMEQVFGKEGYRCSYSEMNTFVLPSGQVMLSCKCHIDIMACDGTVLYTAEGYGSYEITISKDRERYLHLGTAALDLNVNAFKAACRELGIFACRDAAVIKAKKAAGKSSNAAASGGSTGSGAKAVSMKRFFLKKPLTEFWKDRDGKPAYRMVASEMMNDKVSVAECEILFYPNQYKNAVEKLNELIGRSLDTTGFRITLGVTDVNQDRKNKDYAASYVFKRFGEG